MDYRAAVRRSFLAKIITYLQTNGLRDMSRVPSFNQGVADFVFRNTTYGIVPRVVDEELFYPGVNITFIDETDASTNRATKKRYLLTTKITVTKAIQGNTTPWLGEIEVLGVIHLILQALSDGRVDIWDYDLATPAYTGVFASYHGTGYKLMDESLAVPGGDIRHSIVLLINYMDPSF